MANVFFLKEMFEQNDIVLVLIRGGGFNSLRAKLIRLYMNIDLLRLNNTHTIVEYKCNSCMNFEHACNNSIIIRVTFLYVYTLECDTRV